MSATSAIRSFKLLSVFFSGLIPQMLKLPQ